MPIICIVPAKVQKSLECSFVTNYLQSGTPFIAAACDGGMIALFRDLARPSATQTLTVPMGAGATFAHVIAFEVLSIINRSFYSS